MRINASDTRGFKAAGRTDTHLDVFEIYVIQSTLSVVVAFVPHCLSGDQLLLLQGKHELTVCQLLPDKSSTIT